MLNAVHMWWAERARRRAPGQNYLGLVSSSGVKMWAHMNKMSYATNISSPATRTGEGGLPYSAPLCRYGATLRRTGPLHSAIPISSIVPTTDDKVITVARTAHSGRRSFSRRGSTVRLRPWPSAPFHTDAPSPGSPRDAQRLRIGPRPPSRRQVADREGKPRFPT